MPTDPRKRQKKQERRAAKRKAKRHELVRAQSMSVADQLAAADRYPVLDSFITEAFWTEGIGSAYLSRTLPHGLVGYGVFLVDRFCLGVKDAFARVENRSVYDSQVVRRTRTQFRTRDLPPPALRKLIESAVAYAEALGIHPHPDYHKAKRVFGTINPAESAEEFEFGKDGKPFFVAGPHDTPERCRRILRTLEQHCGPGGYDFMVPFADEVFGPGSAVLEDDELDEDDGPDLIGHGGEAGEP